MGFERCQAVEGAGRHPPPTVTALEYGSHVCGGLAESIFRSSLMQMEEDSNFYSISPTVASPQLPLFSVMYLK